MNNVLVFDTETTGLPKNWSAPMTDVNNWPRIIQLAYVLYSPTGELLKEREALIKPDGWEVPTGKFWVDNGFTQQQNETQGRLFGVVAAAMAEDMPSCGTIVAHNMKYDRNVLGAEFIRYGMKGPKIPNWLCTMYASTNYCRISNGRGGFKWPTLTELHRFLFQQDFPGAHDALSDVRACGRCFFELRRRKII